MQDTSSIAMAEGHGQLVMQFATQRMSDKVDWPIL